MPAIPDSASTTVATPEILARIFHKPPPERWLEAGFSQSEHLKSVPDRRSTLSPIQSGVKYPDKTPAKKELAIADCGRDRPRSGGLLQNRSNEAGQVRHSRSGLISANACG
jgi:hypothetical protein